MSPTSSSPGTSSTFSAAVNLAKYCIGAGILALPFATQKGGLLFSPMMIAVIAAWNYLASSLLMQCKEACKNVIFPSHLSSTYSKVAYAGAGKAGVLVTDFSIIVTLLGVCIAFQITFATLLSDLPGNPLSNTALTIISGIIVYPISCFRDLESISSLSLVGMICLVAGVIAILAHGVHAFGDVTLSVITGNNTVDGVDIPLLPTSLQDTIAFLGVTIFCFDICSLAFPVAESMKHKGEFGKAVAWSLVSVWAVYVFLGDLGAVLYVHDKSKGISENILSNLPVHSTVSLMVRWAMACVGLLTYPITLAPAAQMLEHHLRVHYDHFSSYNSCTRCNSYQRISSTASSPVDRAPIGATSSSSAGYHTLSVDSPGRLVTASESADLPTEFGAQHMHPSAEDSSAFLRCTNRLAMVCATTFVAAYIPCFGMVVSLLGCFTIAILDFILPPLLHLRIVYYGSYRSLLCAHQPELMGADASAEFAVELSSHTVQKENFSGDSESGAGSYRSIDARNHLDGARNSPYHNAMHSIEHPHRLSSHGKVTSQLSESELRKVWYKDVVLLTVGTVVCVVATSVSFQGIYTQISSGQTC